MVAFNSIASSLSHILGLAGSGNGSEHVSNRSDWTPYLGHVPYFAPKMSAAQKHSLSR